MHILAEDNGNICSLRRYHGAFMRPSLNAKELALEAVKGNIKHNGSRVFATRGLLFFDKKKKQTGDISVGENRHQSWSRFLLRVSDRLFAFPPFHSLLVSTFKKAAGRGWWNRHTTNKPSEAAV